MKRAHRVALKPTSDQESLFSQHAGYRAVCLQLGAGRVQGWPGRWRMAEPPVPAAALEPGQGHHRAVVSGIEPERGQVRDH